MCAGLAAAARIDQGEKHRSPTRNTPQPQAFRGTDAKEFPIPWEHRILAQAALVRAMGVAGLTVAVDRRLLVGRPPPFAQRMRMLRLYRPTRDDITPTMIDGLYSEHMGLRD